MAESNRTRRFILVGLTALLSATAGALFFFFSTQTVWTTDVIIQTASLTAIAWVAETQAVQFSKRVTVSSANLPVLLAIFFLGPAQGALVACLSLFAVSRGKDFLRVIFVLASNALSVMMVGAFFALLDNTFGYTVPVSKLTLGFVLIGITAGVLWETADFAFASTGVALRFNQHIGSFWKNNFLKALPSQLLILGVGIVIAAVYIKAGIAAAALFFVPIFVSQHVFKLLVQQKELLAEQTKLSEDLMEMNIGLAGALICSWTARTTTRPAIRQVLPCTAGTWPA